jgi:hypothetical protein
VVTGHENEVLGAPRSSDDRAHTDVDRLAVICLLAEEKTRKAWALSRLAGALLKRDVEGPLSTLASPFYWLAETPWLGDSLVLLLPRMLR